MGYVIPDFELDDYPLNRGRNGEMELLEAKTIYYWEENYWLAVLKVRASYGAVPKDSVRIYRWQWKNDRNGNLRWLIDQKFNINKRSIWNKTSAVVDEMITSLK